MDATIGEMTVRFKIQSGSLSLAPDPHHLHKGKPSDHQFFYGRLEYLVKGLQKLTECIALPDVEFVATVNDCGHDRGDPTLAPLFVFSKNRNVHSHVLIPDVEALNGYSSLERQIDIASRTFPWKKKLNKAFWRGATSDGWYDVDHWMSNSRAQLVLMSLQFPNLIDAKFNFYVSGAESNPAMLAIPELKGSYISPQDSLAFKYLIDIDGCTCSWSRCYWTLLSNCAVFKQVTDNVQWFYGALIPNYHFVPLKRDLSDLPDQIHLAIKNDRKMQNIAKQGTTFAKENLSEEMIYLYLYLLLVSYAELQQ